MPKTKFYSEQITNNALSMAESAFQHVQGYTGTIPNPFIFPEELRANLKVDEGANGKILYTLLAHNDTVVQLGDESASVSEAVKSVWMHLRVLWKDKGKLHAIIDIGAHFKKYTNEEVAKELLKSLKDIKAVIFFDKDNRLAYIKGDAEARILEASDGDTLTTATGVQEESRFTFYDQRHCTGTDIPQPLSSYALATIGTSTTTRDALQGFFRMRKLLEDPSISQKIVIGVTASLGNFIRTTIDAAKPHRAHFHNAKLCSGSRDGRHSLLLRAQCTGSAEARKHSCCLLEAGQLCACSGHDQAY